MIDWNFVVSLFSVFVAYLAIRESKKTTQGTTISNSRQTWINELRHEIMEALSIIDYLPDAYANRSISTNDAINIEHRKLIEKSKMIKLLINRDEGKHRNLIRYIMYVELLMTEWINAYEIILYHNNQPPVDPLILRRMIKNFDRAEKRIVELSQDIFKEEWKRVKKGN